MRPAGMIRAARAIAFLLAGSLVGSTVALAQRLTGELRLHVVDATGAALAVTGTLTGQASGVRRMIETDEQGRCVVRALPFGPYRLALERQGFAAHSALIEIRSENPLEHRFALGVAPVETAVVVRDSDTLLDPRRTGAMQHLGPEMIAGRRGSQPGRGVLELVNTQPGWLLEANGILHPRGSEYDVQYVIDGVPLYDNRSPAFAQSLGIEEFGSMNVRTAGFPAEFGRKLGGVIEVVTSRDDHQGMHGKAVLQGGSFDHRIGFASVQWSGGKTTAALSGEGQVTDRYLDAPVEENFSNRGSGGALAARLERDWSERNRTRLYLHTRHMGFLVPNERFQQAAGQRQDRSAEETLGQAVHTHLFSPRLIGHFRGMARDTSARLWSNPASTPIQPSQERGFREAYGGASVSYQRGGHEIKAGVEASVASIHENFAYRIVRYRIDNVRVFDGEVPAEFRFTDRRRGYDQSAFVQDFWRLGPLTVSAGLRFDHYKLVADENAWSPRIGVAYHVAPAGLVLRASYDRVFQTPAIENILLASSDLVPRLGGEGAFLPLEPSRGNFWEAGFSKSMGGKFRLDGAWFRRRVDNFADDSLLLNTGVSFPIAFREADIQGYEAKIEIPRWGPFSGFLSYANMTGTGQLPVAGGLFLGDEAEELLEGEGSFPISQDQRNTFRARVRVQPHPRFWWSFGAAYNSGLPFEIEGPSDEDFTSDQYGARILGKVNFDRGRVRPSATLDAAAGVELIQRERRKLRLQADVMNLANRLNVINFAGLFSGTAIEPRRSFALRLQAEF